MKLKINGEEQIFDDAATVARVVADLGLPNTQGGVAVAVNDTVVPRGKWEATKLENGDTIEVIHAVQGG